MKGFLLYLMFCVSLALVFDLIPPWCVMIVASLALFYLAYWLYKTQLGE